MHTITVKFGGSSLASAEQIRKAADIILADPARRYVVCSAPGKRSSSDTKVTDLLYRCCNAALAGEDFEPALAEIGARFADIIAGLGVDFDLAAELDLIRTSLKTKPQLDYMASRGEYLNSKIIAAFLGFPFVDPALYIHFTDSGVFEPRSTETDLGNALRALDRAVIAGFYGALPDGTVHTFSRGGSDLTGSIVAGAVRAELYENWTDVSGMLAADPRVVSNPRPIDYITYHELRELSYMGASVLHEEAVFPVRRANIPINIRNTNRPQDPGTMIEASLPRVRRPRAVTGIAGKKGFSSIQVEKSLMNSEVGFGATLLRILAEHNISFEHCPTGIDTISVFVHTESLEGCREALLRDLKSALDPEVLLIEDGLALLAVVGQGMAFSRGIAAKVFSACAEAGVNIRMIDQGSSELNIIIGVEEADYEAAIRAIYAAVM